MVVEIGVPGEVFTLYIMLQVENRDCWMINTQLFQLFLKLCRSK